MKRNKPGSSAGAAGPVVPVVWCSSGSKQRNREMLSWEPDTGFQIAAEVATTQARDSVPKEIASKQTHHAQRTVTFYPTFCPVNICL